MKKNRIINIVKWLVIFILILSLIALGTGWVFRQEIKAYFIAKQYSSKESIQEEITKKEESQKETIKNYTQVEINPLSDEEGEALAQGNLTVEDAVKIIIGSDKGEEQNNLPSQGSDDKSEANNNTVETNQNTGQESENDKKKQQEFETKLGEKVATIYALKAKYQALIKKADYDMIEEYKKIPKEERVSAVKYKLAGQTAKVILGYQKQCDGEMEKLLKEMSDLLTENGQSLELVDQIRKAYNEEKELNKAYYMNKYTD